MLLLQSLLQSFLKMMNSCNSKLANTKWSQSSPTVIASCNLHLVSNPTTDCCCKPVERNKTFQQQPAPKQLQHKWVELDLRKQRQ